MAEPAAVERTPPPMAELRVAARAAWPEGLIDLSRSEPLPVPVSPACSERMQEEFMRSRMYAPPAGLGAAREAVARHMGAATGQEVGADRVAITAGAMHGISISLRALVGPGSEVLVPRPYFHAHPKQVAMLGSEPRFVDVRAERGVVTAEAIERELSPRTGALLLCNPANPAGVVLGRAQLERILAVLPPSVAVISDEVYAEYLYDGEFTSMLGLVAEEDAGREVVVVNTASKTAAMPGWRVGSAVGSPGLAPRLGRASATMSGAPSTPAQLAYAAWLDDPPEVERMAPYRPRLREVLEAVGNAGLSVRPPDGTYYVWAGTDAEADPSGARAAAGGAGLAAAGIGSPERVLEAARTTGALVWPGVLFGDLQSVRISLSVPRRELREGVTRLADSWREVQPSDVPISRSGS